MNEFWLRAGKYTSVGVELNPIAPPDFAALCFRSSEAICLHATGAGGMLKYCSE